MRSGKAWLELLWAIGLLALVFQLFPHLWDRILWSFDFRHWPRSTWFILNFAVFLTFLAVRFAPDLFHQWRQRQKRRAVEQAKKLKQQELNEQRAVLKRMKEGQKRRIY
jgi:hypothetical protein